MIPTDGSPLWPLTQRNDRVVLTRIFDVMPFASFAEHQARVSWHKGNHIREDFNHAPNDRTGISHLAVGEVLRFRAGVAQVALVIEVLSELCGVLRIPPKPLGAAPGQRILGEQPGWRPVDVLLLNRKRTRPARDGLLDGLGNRLVEDLVFGGMPERDLRAALDSDLKSNLVVVLLDEVADASFEISQDREGWRLHTTKTPGVAQGWGSQPQRNGTGAIQTEMIVLILSAEGLEIGGIVPLAGIRFFCHLGKGTADRDIIQRTQPEAIHTALVAQVLEHLPGNHRAFAPRIRCNNDPLDPLQSLFDL